MELRSVEFLREVAESDVDSSAVRSVCSWAAGELDRLQAENAELRKRMSDHGDWDYERLVTILRDELPLTMTLGLLSVLVGRMARERFFRERVDGIVDVVKKIARDAVLKAKEEKP